MNAFKSLLGVLALVTLCPVAVYADSDTLNVEATIIEPLDLDCSRTALSFGSIDAGRGGTVSMGTNGIADAAGGGAVLITGTGAQAGVCTLEGQPDDMFQLSIDATTVRSPSGATMAIGNFQVDDGGGSAPAPYVSALDSTGQATLDIGADLTVSNGQAAGDYSGQVTVTAIYD